MTCGDSARLEGGEHGITFVAARLDRRGGVAVEVAGRTALVALASSNTRGTRADDRRRERFSGISCGSGDASRAIAAHDPATTIHAATAMVAVKDTVGLVASSGHGPIRRGTTLHAPIDWSFKWN